MTETKFVNQNREQWKAYKQMAESPDSYEPSEVGQAYLQLSSDLAFAQSHFAGTQVCDYLNALALQLHQHLYRRRPSRWTELKDFFAREIPMAFYNNRRFMLIALTIFLFGDIIGIISQMLDTDYFLRFFGYSYYDTSMRNIESGNPMGIYGDEPPFKMFIDIATNNIIVSFRFFIEGLLTPLVVVMDCILTGIMDGCFTTFFGQHGYLKDALIAPNEHGSLELPCIIVSGAAGLRLGFGWVFPGNKSRLTGLREGAIEGMKMMTAVTLILVVAAFIEGFVTRHQDINIVARLFIIAAGFGFIWWYCVSLPKKVWLKTHKND